MLHNVSRSDRVLAVRILVIKTLSHFPAEIYVGIGIFIVKLMQHDQPLAVHVRGQKERMLRRIPQEMQRRIQIAGERRQVFVALLFHRGAVVADSHLPNVLQVGFLVDHGLVRFEKQVLHEMREPALGRTFHRRSRAVRILDGHQRDGVVFIHHNLQSIAQHPRKNVRGFRHRTRSRRRTSRRRSRTSRNRLGLRQAFNRKNEKKYCQAELTIETLAASGRDGLRAGNRREHGI